MATNFNMFGGAPPLEAGADMQRAISDAVRTALTDRPAMPIPAYLAADLPSAAANPNAIVRVTDNPQGQASSNGVDWLSDVDGSNLGPGNG